jgi:hypothetical protein
MSESVPQPSPRQIKIPVNKLLTGTSCSGGRTRTHDLRVMSPTSYQLLYPTVYFKTACVGFVGTKIAIFSGFATNVQDFCVCLAFQEN